MTLWFVLATSSLLSAEVRCPVWLREQLREAEPSGVAACVLLDELQVVVGEKGDWTELRRYAVRVNTDAGRSAAQYAVEYVKNMDEVEETSVWLVKPDGGVGTLGKAAWVDSARLSEDSLYTDFRQKGILARREVPLGGVFACEVKVRRKGTQGELVWAPSHPWELVRARLSVRLPKGWELRDCWQGFRTPNLPELRDGLRVWELGALPALTDEDSAPEMPERFVLLAFLAPGGSGGAAFGWGALSQSMYKLQESACDLSDGMKRFGLQQAASYPDIQERLRAICRHVQACRYAADYRSLAQGFGYKPRKASETFSARYGDCKDKVNLLRALLRDQGITVYPLLVSTHMQTGWEEQWPGVLSFNHVIAAIQVPESFKAGSVAELPGLGRCLLFDPTSEIIPPGELPWSLQGKQALPCTTQGSGLVRLPEMAPALRLRQQRLVKAQFYGKGLIGTTVFTYHGEAADSMDWVYKRREPSRKKEVLQEWMRQSVPDVMVVESTLDMKQGSEEATLKASFGAARFGQRMINGVWIFRADLLARYGLPPVGELGRRRHFVCSPVVDEETLVLGLPADWSLERIPEPVVLEGGFGCYRLSFTLEDGCLVRQRDLTLHGGLVAPGDFPAFRSFILAVARADQKSLVLRRFVDTSDPTLTSH